MNKNLGVEVSTKIANEVSARLSEINSELNSKLTAKAKKNKARDDDFTREAQKIFLT
jgi:hypothetical protein